MKQVQQARLDALHRMQAFMDENADALGNVNKSRSRAALDDVLTQLEARAEAQGSAEVQAAGATADKNALREDLRLHQMQPIAAIARATLAHTPLIAKLRLPSGKVNDSTLVQRGNAMADVASQYRDVFIAEQLPADFIKQLRASVEAVRKAAVSRDGFQVDVTEATQAVDDEMARAHNVVKVLNSLVVKQLKGKSDLLAGWRRAKHAKAKPGVPQGTTGSVVPIGPKAVAA
ncbi:MAG TPA: hypothetical protein VIH11_05120 [Gemmatimonadaceae bacterium]|nr:hypothetical protein [Gemmatimonadaceae bacterium]HLC28630.1 hypothetical protein [Dehalococcoidia bacterium]